MAVVTVLGLGAYLFARMDDEIRFHAEQVLTEKFPHLNVSVGGARLVEGRGVAVYDVALSETTSTQLQDNLLMIDEILLECDIQLSQLAKGIPAIKRVIVEHPQLWVSRTREGTWNLESLWPLPPCGESRPQVVIRDAQVSIRDERNARLQPLVFRDVNLLVRPSHEQKLAVENSLGLAQGSAMQTLAQPLVVEGQLGGTGGNGIEIQAEFDPRSQTFRLTADLQQFVLTPELLASAASYAPDLMGRSELQGRVDGRITLEHVLSPGNVPQFDAELSFSSGRVEDPRVPYALTQISCAVHCDNAGLKIHEMHGKLGLAQLAMQLERRGWNASAPMALAVGLKNMPLDNRLYSTLPEILQQQWSKYRPAGTVDGELQLAFDGKDWKPVAKLTGRDLAFESDKFPYRVNKGSGTLQYSRLDGGKPAQLDIDLVGYGGGQPLKIVGQVFDPRPGAAGWVEITGQGVEIEQEMIEAIPAKTRKVVESLHPAGRFDLYWRLDRRRPGQRPETSLLMELADCRIKYDKFPYPLTGIHGQILAENKNWVFRDLLSSGTRNVRCQGYLQPKGAGTELSLQFTGHQIPLDVDLKQALPEQVQRAWDEIRPRGQVDLAAHVTHETGFQKPSIRVSVQPRNETATIQPRFFPYLLEQLEGDFDYQDGQLFLSNVRARHGPTMVRSNGSGIFPQDGGWRFQLTDLSVDRLAARRDLIVALPPKLQRLIDRLKPTGSFRLHDGTLTFAKSRDATESIDSRWKVTLDCHQSDLQAGVELRNIHGSVQLEGENAGGRCFSRGEMAIDTATFKDVQVTNIRGPLWVDEMSCRLGHWATEAQQLPSRRLLASVYGGDLVGDAWVSFDALPLYKARASLAGADLARVMTERFRSQEPFTGKLAANIHLDGRGKSLDNLVGQGDVKITDANIYEIPLLVGLLKVLRNSTPDTTAFNQSNMRFRIQGRHIYLDQLDFLGDAVSLFGKGYTNFDHQLNLVFRGAVGRNEINIPLVKNILGQASQQIMQMYVGGTLADPQVQTHAFPGIKNLIQQIQAELDGSAAASGTREAKRSHPILPRWGKQQ